MEIGHTVFKVWLFLVSLYIFAFAYIDDGNEENWQNILININFCKYFANIL